MHRRTPSSSRSLSSSSQPLLALPSHEHDRIPPRTPKSPTPSARRNRRIAFLAIAAFATVVALLARSSSSRNEPGNSDRLSSRIKSTASRLLSLRPFASSSSSPSLPPPSAPIILAPLPRPTEVNHADPWTYSADPSTLPPCERILLFTFMPWWGFASEYILYARAAAAAKKLNYTFLEDDRNWNYGRLSNYFLPRTISCVPPSDWTDPRLAVSLTPSSASHSPPHARLKYSRLTLSDIDDWTRETYLSFPDTQASLVALQESDLAHRVARDRWILGEGETLPEAFGEVFVDQSEWVRENWRVAGQVARGVEAVRRAVGLDSPRWLAGEEGEGEGEGRGPVVAVHVRLGDKASEYEHDAEEMGITNSFGNLTVYIEAAHDAYRRLIPSPYAPLSLSRPTSSPSDVDTRFSPYAPPTLLLVTAEPSIPSRLRAEVPLADPWRVVQSPRVEIRGGVEGVGVGRKVGGTGRKGAGRPKAYAAAQRGAGKMTKVVAPRSLPSRGRSKRAALEAGYTQQTFNALPLLERVAHTQDFVRDLTLMTQGGDGRVDAAVVSGASNVGRLAMLIAGKEAVMGPREPLTGRPLGGRIRSVDAHFYPTAYSSAVYTKVEDVEDLENAAFVPEEQRAEGKGGAVRRRRRTRRKGGRKGDGVRGESRV